MNDNEGEDLFQPWEANFAKKMMKPEKETRKTPSQAVRVIVSKKKIRFQDDGFDLDLAYITKRIIAMGFPSSGSEGLYRNHIEDVERFFSSRHNSHFRVYNLCSEKTYDTAVRFGGQHIRLPFDDHNPPVPISLIPKFLTDAGNWLDAHQSNIIAVHCKAGKGRTGVMICTLLLAQSVHPITGKCMSTEEAMRIYGRKRTHDGKGVTIPSQIRYIRYWEKILNSGGCLPPVRAFTLTSLTVDSTIKNTGTREIYLTVTQGDSKGYKKEIYDSRKDFTHKATFSEKDQAYHFDTTTLSTPVVCYGDVLIKVKRKIVNTELFSFWLNLNVEGMDGEESLSCVIPKSGMDKAAKTEGYKQSLQATVKWQEHVASPTKQQLWQYKFPKSPPGSPKLPPADFELPPALVRGSPLKGKDLTGRFKVLNLKATLLSGNLDDEFRVRVRVGDTFKESHAAFLSQSSGSVSWGSDISSNFTFYVSNSKFPSVNFEVYGGSVRASEVVHILGLLPSPIVKGVTSIATMSSVWEQGIPIVQNGDLAGTVHVAAIFELDATPENLISALLIVVISGACCSALLESEEESPFSMVSEQQIDSLPMLPVRAVTGTLQNTRKTGSKRWIAQQYLISDSFLVRYEEKERLDLSAVTVEPVGEQGICFDGICELRARTLQERNKWMEILEAASSGEGEVWGDSASQEELWTIVEDAERSGIEADAAWEYDKLMCDYFGYALLQMNKESAALATHVRKCTSNVKRLEAEKRKLKENQLLLARERAESEQTSSSPPRAGSDIQSVFPLSGHPSPTSEPQDYTHSRSHSQSQADDLSDGTPLTPLSPHSRCAKRKLSVKLCDKCTQTSEAFHDVNALQEACNLLAGVTQKLTERTSDTPQPFDTFNSSIAAVIIVAVLSYVEIESFKENESVKETESMKENESMRENESVKGSSPPRRGSVFSMPVYESEASFSQLPQLRELGQNTVLNIEEVEEEGDEHSNTIASWGIGAEHSPVPTKMSFLRPLSSARLLREDTSASMLTTLNLNSTRMSRLISKSVDILRRSNEKVNLSRCFIRWLRFLSVNERRRLVAAHISGSPMSEPLRSPPVAPNNQNLSINSNRQSRMKLQPLGLMLPVIEEPAREDSPDLEVDVSVLAAASLRRYFKKWHSKYKQEQQNVAAAPVSYRSPLHNPSPGVSPFSVAIYTPPVQSPLKPPTHGFSMTTSTGSARKRSSQQPQQQQQQQQVRRCGCPQTGSPSRRGTPSRCPQCWRVT